MSARTVRGGYRMIGSWAIVHVTVKRLDRTFHEAELGIAFRRSIFTFKVTRRRGA